MRVVVNGCMILPYVSKMEGHCFWPKKDHQDGKGLLILHDTSWIQLLFKASWLPGGPNWSFLN